MPSNKLAALRYRIIDNCLQQRSILWTTERLQAAVTSQLQESLGKPISLSIRQLRDDITTMRRLPPDGFDAPIVADRRTRAYRYEDPQFSILGRPLTSHDLRCLREILGMLRQYEGLPHVTTITTLLDRLQSGHWPVGKPVSTIIYFEVNPLAAGLHWIAPIHEAILQERTLLIEYKPFTSELPVSLEVIPHQLREYRNRWFLLGTHSIASEPVTLALDRIQELTPGAERKSQVTFNAAERYRHIVGVSVPSAEPIPVCVWASAEQVPYLMTKPFHSSQQSSEPGPNGSRYFTYLLQLNYELESELLAFGERVEVIAPESLRLRLAERLMLALARYSTTPIH